MVRKLLVVLTLITFLNGCVTAGAHFQSLKPEQQISEVQSDLKKLGYYRGSVDGVYGKQTAKSIRDFQRDKGMTQNGQVSKSVYIQAGLTVTEQRKKNSAYTGQRKTKSNKNRQMSTMLKKAETAHILQSNIPTPPGAPNNSVIEDAVRAELKNNIPERWVNATLVGRNEKFRTMEIIKWGIFNKERNYWPIRVRFTGRATVIPPFGKSFSREFDGIGEFRFFKDDFGDWKSVFLRPNLFG